MPPGDADTDPTVRTLARLFAEHPAWLEAAARLDEACTSAVFFGHRPGEPWHLARSAGRPQLLPGPAADADFAFRFPPAAVEQLASVEGGIGEFAVMLFRLMGETSPRLRVGFRSRAPFSRLVRRGYLGLLVAAGGPLLAFGASRGVRTLRQLRRLVEVSRRGDPEDWETDLAPSSGAGG